MAQPDARARLADLMDQRRLDLRKQWKDVARGADISTAALGAIRRGEYKPSSLTARGIEDALEWEHGSIDAILHGGSFGEAASPTAEPPLPENLAALIGSTDNPTPSTDLASILSRLNEVTEQLAGITADVTVHGVVGGRDAIRMIGEYGMAWNKLVEGVQRAATQGGLIDAQQLLGVMQELHDRFGLQTRPPKGNTAKEATE